MEFLMILVAALAVAGLTVVTAALAPKVWAWLGYSPVRFRSRLRSAAAGWAFYGAILAAAVWGLVN